MGPLLTLQCVKSPINARWANHIGNHIHCGHLSTERAIQIHKKRAPNVFKNTVFEVLIETHLKPINYLGQSCHMTEGYLKYMTTKKDGDGKIHVIEKGYEKPIFTDENGHLFRNKDPRKVKKEKLLNKQAKLDCKRLPVRELQTKDTPYPLPHNKIKKNDATKSL